MVFQLGAEYNDSAQGSIDDQVQSQDQVRTSVTLPNQQGSFSLAKGVLATFPNGQNLTCTGNDGNNALHFVSSTNVSVAQFNKGVLRFEKTTQINELMATSAKIALAESTVENMQIQDCYLQMVSCQPQTASISGGATESFENQYQGSTTFSGSTAYSQGDKFNGSVTISGNSRIHFISATFNGSVSLSDNPMVHFDDCTFNGDLSGSGQITFNAGKAETVSLSNEDTHALIDGTQVSGTLDVQDGVYVVNNAQISGSLVAENCVINSRDSKGSDMVISSSKAIFSNGQFATSEINDSQICFTNKSKIATITMNGGSLKSDSTQGAALTITGGTIASGSDQFATVTGTGLVGPNSIDGLKSPVLTLQGNGNAPLIVTGTNSAATNLSSFGNIQMSDCSPAQLSVSDTKFCLMADCTVQAGAVTDVNQFLGAGSDFTSLILTNVDLGVTNGVDALIVTGCGTIVDNGSTMQASESIISGTESTITGVACLANMQGGTGTFTGDSVVNTTGAEITNATGYTSGMGFDYLQQAASTLYDGALTVSATLGDVRIYSTTGDVDLRSFTGSINNQAAIDIGNIALGEVITSAGTGIITTAIAGGITVTATAGSIETTATAGNINTTAVAGNMTNIAGGFMDNNAGTFTITTVTTLTLNTPTVNVTTAAWSWL